MNRHGFGALVLACVTSATYACGDGFGGTFSSSSSEGGTNTGTGAGGAGASTGSGIGAGEPLDCSDPPLFETDIVPLFEQSCGAGDDKCHSRVAFAATLDMDCRGWLSLENADLGAIIYAGAEEGQSTGCPDMSLYTRLMMNAWQCGPPGVPDEAMVPYVKPCDPEGSYLIRKMTGGNVGGPICKDANGTTLDPMPPDEQPIQAEIDLVYNWIAAGAPTLANPDCACGDGGGGAGGGDPAQDPVPNIAHPSDGETRPANTPVPFTGEAIDPQDGAIPESRLRWYSSLDGALNGGQGSAMFSQTLSVGTHTITLEAEDTDGNIGADAITLTIAP